MPDAIYLQNGLTNANVVLVGGVCYEKVGTVEHPADTFAIQGEFDNCFDCENRGSSSSSVPPANPCDCSGSQPAATVTAHATNVNCASSGTVQYKEFIETASTCKWVWENADGSLVHATYYKSTGLTDVDVELSPGSKCSGGKPNIPGAMCIDGKITLNATDIRLDAQNPPPHPQYNYYDVSLG